MVQITLDNLPEVLKKIEDVAPKLRAQLRQDFNETSVSTVSWLRTSRLTGGTSATRLAVRSGKLRASVRPELVPTSTPIGGFNAGISFGTIYARTHIRSRSEGDAIIRAKPGHALAIPFRGGGVGGSLTNAGVSRGGPLSSIYRETFISKGIIFGKVGRISTAGRVKKDKIVPLFILRKQVKIPTRITTEEIVDKMGKILLPRLRFIAKEAGL